MTKQEESGTYGLMAEFDDPNVVIVAARRTYEACYRRINAYSPYPLEELSEAIGYHRNYVPLVVLIVQRIRRGSFVVQAPWPGRLWFALTGICNGLSLLTQFAALRYGPITLVTPIGAIYPLVTVLLSAMLLQPVRITLRIVAGTVLTVAGVALVLAG